MTSKSESSGYLNSKSRIRISDLHEAKKLGEKWAMLTSYDAVSARVFDHAKIPCLLIGDSAAQSIFGYKSTLPVTVDELISLSRAVSTSSKRSLVISDLPFGSYQESPALALRTASRFMKEAGVHGVKLEGGKDYSEHVKVLTRAGVPVMAHIGFTPQSEHQLSGFKVQGRRQADLERLVDDALALEAAGAFACVLELVPREVGRAVTQKLKIPTIGIGAGPDCDAQVLVWNDMAGFSAPKGQGAASYMSDASSKSQIEGVESKPVFELDRAPKFVKRYFNMSEMLYKAAVQYAKDVRSGSYPAEEHCYK